MDKQMIEEMAMDIAVRMAMAKGVAGSMNNGVEGWLAEYLIEKGWAKIPEGAVVLMGTETEEYLEDLLVEFDEMSFYPATLMPNAEECAREWKRKLIYAIGKLRKETVEKFAEMARKAFMGVNCIDIDEWNWFLNKIDEICKEITEGKV